MYLGLAQLVARGVEPDELAHAFQIALVIVKLFTFSPATHARVAVPIGSMNARSVLSKMLCSLSTSA